MTTMPSDGCGNARMRRRPRPCSTSTNDVPSSVLVLLAAAALVSVSLPLLAQAFQPVFSPRGAASPAFSYGPTNWGLMPPPCNPPLYSISSDSSGRRRRTLILMAKPKKSLDAAKAAALAALEQLEAVEAAAAPMPASTDEGTQSPLDKKLAKKARKEREKAEKEAMKAAAISVLAEKSAAGPKAARAAALAALEAEEGSGEEEAVVDTESGTKSGEKNKDDEEMMAGEEDEDTALMALLNQGGGGSKKKKKKKGGGEDTSFALEGKERKVARDVSAGSHDLELSVQEGGQDEPVASPGVTAPTPAAESKSPPPSGDDHLLPERASEDSGPTLEERVRATRPPGRVRVLSDGAAAPGTAFVRLDKVSVIFRNQEVLKDASWGVQTGERVGLVGPNGGGKTTQLKVLAGELDPTTGEVMKSSKELKIAFLRQEFVDELVMGRSLKDELLSVFEEEQGVLEKLRALEGRLEGATGDMEQMNEILQELGETQQEADRRGVYGLETKVDKIMDLMGFAPSDASLPVRSFSGGWKMRIGLGKVLLQEPGVLLLDEPTNHLDLDSVEWLEQFLRTQSLPMAIVSHDREFLDRVCTKIVDCDGGETVTYTGNYSNFVKQKRARLEAWQKAYDQQQKKIQEDKDFINRFRANSARATQVKAREASLEKLMKGEDLIKRPPYQGTAFRFRFPPGPRLHGEVVAIESLKFGYGNRELFDDTSLTVEKGHRVAIIGPNGVGKSTILRLVMGLEKAWSGKAAITASNVEANYFEQNQADALALDQTVDETVVGASSTESYNQLRALMAQFMFKGDSIYKKVAQLSGGEKARLAMCKMMLKPGNLLCLDEPTNHLDIPAKEILEEACRNYEGSILLVSHDRYFISQVANRIVAVEDKKLMVYEGDYQYYMEKNEEMKRKIEKRYVDGLDGIRSAPKLVEGEKGGKGSGKKNFGGKAPGISGRKEKGIKNAKRMSL